MSAPVTRNLTILLTDIKGFTDKTSHKSRAEIQQMLDKHKELVLPVLEAKGGKLVKTIGDAFLMTFESPTDAVLAGVQAQEALRQHNCDKEHADRIEIRIAINQGEVNLSDNDVFGEPVNITARIEAIAEAGEVFFTDAVYLAMNKKEVPSSEVGLLQLKGIPEKVRVYKVKRERPVEVGAQVERLPRARRFLQALNPLGAPAVVPSGHAKPRLWRRLGALAIDGVLCALIIGLFWPGETKGVRITRKLKSQPAAAGPGALSVKSPEGDVSVGPDGIKIEGPHGKVAIGKRGVKLDGKDKDLKLHVSLDGVDVEDAAEEEQVYDEDGTTVSRIKKKKDLRFALVWFLYSVLFVKALGTTPGGKICKLAVVPMAGSGPLERKQNLIRAFFSLISGYCLFLGYLWALWERDGRGWHDLMAGTRVTQTQ
ncbi:MAG: RDD family protein [Elusimicrobia bacterium]|nr:RDD family protein [Elusimicrobiota bacterium]